MLGVLGALLGLGDSDSVLDLAGHESEGLLDVLAVFRRSLQEANVKVFSQLLAFFEGDSALILEVALVTDEDARDVVRGVALDLPHPGLYSRETFSVRNVIGHDDAMGALVVGRGNGFKAFLAGSVPDLELDGLAVDINSPDLEVNTDSGHEVLSEEVVLAEWSGMFESELPLG